MVDLEEGCELCQETNSVCYCDPKEWEGEVTLELTATKC